MMMYIIYIIPWTSTTILKIVFIQRPFFRKFWTQPPFPQASLTTNVGSKAMKGNKTSNLSAHPGYLRKIKGTSNLIVSKTGTLTKKHLSWGPMAIAGLLGFDVMKTLQFI